jgi:hypothetical protein
MDQFTEDELGLNMMANPNRMSGDMEDMSSGQVNMNQPLFNDVDSGNNYFEHEDENPSYSSHTQQPSNQGGMPNFFDDNASDVSRVSIESTEEVLRKKNFLLTKLKRLQRKGVELSKNVSINTPLHELENEYMMAKKEQDLESNLEWCKKGLVYICSFLEKTNDVMNTGAKLKGWSEEIYNTQDQYDDVLEELLDKYGGDIEMAPEIRLIMMLVGSALAVHMSNTMMKGGIDSNIFNQFHAQKEKAQGMPTSHGFQSTQMPSQPPQPPPMSHTNMMPPIQDPVPPMSMSGPDPRLVEELLNEDMNAVGGMSDSSASSASSNGSRGGRRKKKNSVNISF